MASASEIIRDNAVAALVSANTRAGDSVYTPRSWPTWHQQYPVIIVRTPTVVRASTGHQGPPSFNSVITLAVAGRLEADSEADADELARELGEQIETALLRNSQFMYDSDIQQFASSSFTLKVDASGKRWIGEAQIALGCEVFETFEPTVDAGGDVFPPRFMLDGMNVHADLVNVFDPSGTYSAPTAPPYTPTAAPRTSGPDGRDEGAVQIDLGS